MQPPICKLKPTRGTGLVGGIRHGPEYWKRINKRAKILEDACAGKVGKKDVQMMLPGHD